MAPLDSNAVPAKGITFYISSWVFIADGSGGFDSHLINPSALKPQNPRDARKSTTSLINSMRSNSQFTSRKFEINPNFNVSNPKILSELEEDLDNLLKISRQEAIVN